MRTLIVALQAVLFFPLASAQPADSYPYVFRSFAGSTPPLGDGAAATKAYLRAPNAVALDAAGNIFILDSQNSRIRKIDPSGVISTVVELTRRCSDMALDKDGNFYLASNALIFRVAPDGTVTPVAGTGSFAENAGDGIATSQQVGFTSGIALDAERNVYFVDGARVRKVTVATGRVAAVAGTSTYNYNGDNQPATSANLNSPSALAIDSSGALLISEFGRIRKVVNGTIQTIAGNGIYGWTPDSSPANASPMGRAVMMQISSDGVIYYTDQLSGLIIKVSPISGSAFSTFNWVAGCPGNKNYADGPALSSCLLNPRGLAVSASGNIVVTEELSNRVRQISNGNIRTIAGQFRFAGDGGPATSALLRTC